MTKKKQVKIADIHLEEFDSMEEKLQTATEAKLIEDKESVTADKQKPGRRRSNITESFKDPDFVKKMTIEDINDLTRYQLYRLNKHRTQLGLQSFDRRKSIED